MTVQLEELSIEELRRVILRDRFVKERLAEKFLAAEMRNVELLGIVNELQTDLAEVRETQASLLQQMGGE